MTSSAPRLAARAAVRLARTLLLVPLALSGLTCRDRDLTGPGLAKPARLRVAPRVAALAPRGPALRLGAVRVTLTPEPGTGEPVVSEVATFVPGEDQLPIELTVRLSQPTERFV